MRTLSFIFLLLLPVIAAAQGEAPEDTVEKTEAPETIPAMALTAEAVICDTIANRMPVDTLEEVLAGVEKVYCWSRITGAQDSTIIVHLWLHEGEERARVELPVKSSDWRTWSSKNIRDDWVGQWEVRVLDRTDEVLASQRFLVRPTVGDTIVVEEDTTGGN